jgi:hypothetical protein
MRTGKLQLRTIGLTALALLAPVTALLAQEEPAAFSIQEHSGAHPDSGNWELAISGQWPTRCPPTLENLTLNEHDLRIDARAVLSLCERGATPFSVELNPALALEHATLEPGIYRVSFFAADGAQASPHLRAFALIDHSARNAPTITPETGFWWSSNTADADAARTTLSLELQDGQLSVALLSYDDLGQPVWYFGAAPYAGHIAHVPLLRLAGGSAPFAPVSSAPHGDAVLTLDLEFASGAHASAWLSRTHGGDDASLQLQTLDLVRLPLADSTDGHAWQGEWVLLADAEETTPQRLHFDRYRALDTEHFQLEDAAANVVLLCSRKSAQPEWPPAACSLRQADGTELAFDSVALARMDGQNNQSSVHLLRVSR